MRWRRPWWFYNTNPLQPVTYRSVLGDKLLEYWHSEQGILLDGSLNVQTWTGRVASLVLNQTLGAGARPLYGADASFGGKSVVQCRLSGARCLAYKPGTTIFNAGERPGLVHLSRYATVPDGSAATTTVNMGSANAPTPPAIFINDFFDGTIVTTGKRRQVARTVNHFTPFGLTVFEDAPLANTIPRMGAFGLTATSFNSYVNGQLIGTIASNENLSEPWDQLTVGATAEVGTAGSDCNVAMVFLCRVMPTQFELLQLYYLAKAEWSI